LVFYLIGCSGESLDTPGNEEPAAPPKAQARAGQKKSPLPQIPAKQMETITAEEKQEAKTKDTLEVISTMPVLPATLKVREQFRIKVQYFIASVDEALIFIEPLTVADEDSLGSNSGSYSHRRGSGIKEGFIRFKKPQHLTAIRVTMEDKATRATFCRIDYAVDVRWVEEVPTTADRLEVVATDPSLNSTLNLGGKFYVKIKYIIDSVDEAVIMIKASERSMPVDYQTSTMKTLEKGKGTMVGYISFDSEITLYEIFVTMKAKKTGEELSRIYHEVDVTWK
jgi:hypothetical protein